MDKEGKNPMFRSSDQNFGQKPTHIKNLLPMSPKMIKKKRNLTKMAFDNEMNGSMNLKSSVNLKSFTNYGDEPNKQPGHQQMSVRMSKSFNNSSFTMHGPNPTLGGNVNEQLNLQNVEKIGPNQSHFRSSG